MMGVWLRFCGNILVEVFLWLKFFVVVIAGFVFFLFWIFMLLFKLLKREDDCGIMQSNI